MNPWSDIEKAIFVDKFCQWPKNFRKIAGYLRNKTTGNCIAFYYASKKFINYKLLLREYSNRRRARENTLVYEVDQWSSTLAASKSVGATVKVKGGRYEFTLPRDNQYKTLNHHPPRGPVKEAFINAGLHNLVLGKPGGQASGGPPAAKMVRSWQGVVFRRKSGQCHKALAVGYDSTDLGIFFYSYRPTFMEYMFPKKSISMFPPCLKENRHLLRGEVSKTFEWIRSLFLSVGINVCRSHKKLSSNRE